VTVVYHVKPGERTATLPDGRLIVCHWMNEPFIINLDGTRKTLKPDFSGAIVVECKAGIWVSEGGNA